MKIKVSHIGETPELSRYKLNKERTELDWRTVSSRMYGEHLVADLDQAHEKLKEAWGEALKDTINSDNQEADEQRAIQGCFALCNVVPSLSRRLSQEAIDLLREYMGYFSDNNGNYQWFYRLAVEGQVWDTCVNPIPAMSDRSKGRFKEFQKRWFKLHSNSKVKAWTIFDEETGDLSPLMDDSRLLAIAENLLPPEKKSLISARARDMFLTWADSNFDAKEAPGKGTPKSPVDLLPNLRQVFDPYSTAQGWAASLMKDEDSLQISMPETITNDSEVDAFTYVNLKELVDGETPAWDKWIQSIHPTCREIFMAAVFAPMHAKCRHRKLVWMRSQGYDGKSTFFNALNRWSGGKLTQSFSSHNTSSDFGLEQLIGARILLWGDSQHEHALSTNVVHNITGGDLVTINRKHEKAIQYRFNAMLFVASNARPQLKSWARNETTRLLYIPFIEPKESVLKEFAMTDEKGNVMRQSDGTPIFKGSNLEDELIAEMPHILFKCKEEYKKYCKPPFRDLMVPPEVYDLMLQENEHEDGNEYSAFCSTKLKFEEGLQVPVKDVHDKFKAVCKGQSKQMLGELFRYMERNHGIEKKRLGGRNTQVMYYVGCALATGGPQKTMFEED